MFLLPCNYYYRKICLIIVFVYEHYSRRGFLKKRNGIWVLLIGIILSLVYLQFGRDVRVVSSMINSSDHYYEQKVTIVANKLFILDKDKFAEEMIERCIDNDFHEIKFSYDLIGYPDRIEVTVYLNEIDKQYLYQAFTVKYVPNTKLQLSSNIY